MRFDGEQIWIVGASTGIGAALARELATRGATLLLSARSREGLDTLAAELGSHHRVYPLDVADGAQVETVVRTLAADVPRIDRIIFMAAIYRPQGIGQMDSDFATSLVQVNLCGALYVSYAVLPLLRAQGGGQLVLCGSVAGYTGLPGGQPYSATKAAVANLAESLYAEAEDGIDIKLISPGFVRTRMTDKNHFHMPMRIEPDAAARAIADGLTRHAFEIHFPKRFTYLVKLLHALPYPLTLWVTRRLKADPPPAG